MTFGAPVAESDDLRSEIDSLRARVAELESEIESRPRVQRSPLFALLDVMPLLVGAIAADGTIEYISLAFRPWLAVSRKAATGAAFLPAMIPALRTVAEPLLELALRGEMVQREVSLPDRDGDVRDLQITLVPRRLEGSDFNGCVWVAQDHTQRRRATEALSSSERRLRLATDAAGLGIWDWNLIEQTSVFTDRAKEICGFPLDRPVTMDMLKPSVHPDDWRRSLEHTNRATDPAIKEKSRYEYRIVKPDGSITWVAAQGEAIFEIRDGVEVAVRYLGTIQDVTERTLASQRQQMLMHELNHRVKNTLASVQSIARLTLRADQSPDEARGRLTERLMALAKAHDILTRENWEAAELSDIVAAAVEPYDDPSVTRFEIAGPPLRIPPKVAVALALSLHELATNAAKYGALSGSTGMVAISWRLEDGDERLIFDWREQGGPPVVQPVRTGFGTRLLTRGLVTEFGGEAQLTYAPQGLACHIEAPLDQAGFLELV